MNGKIVYDRSGTMKKGVVWSLALEVLGMDIPAKVIYGDWPHVIKKREETVCSKGKGHLTRSIVEKMLVNVIWGTLIPDFFNAGGWTTFPIVSKHFGDRLSATKLTGFKLRESIVIGDNQSEFRALKLLEMDITGKCALNNRFKVVGIPNQCWKCGKHEIICSECAESFPDCPVCKTVLIERHYSRGKGGLTGDGYDGPDIVDDWDGSDFFCNENFYVSKRAKEWMESTHTFPLPLKPALLCTKR